MKQTAVEFLEQFIKNNQYFIGNDLVKAFEQAKEIELQCDNFAIGFAEWLRDNYVRYTILGNIKGYKELLKIYKKEKGL